MGELKRSAKKMNRVTEIEIKKMRACGYDAATIREDLKAIERSKTADNLIERIAEAFSGITLGDGVGLQQAQGLDDHENAATCAAYRESDEKEDWRKIASADLNRCNSSLSFFDPIGMRFHLPAYMTAELRGKYDFGMAFCLTQMGDYDRYSRLDPIQRQVVRQFLLFLLDDPEYEFERPHIEQALADYWTEFNVAKTTNAEQGRTPDS